MQSGLIIQLLLLLAAANGTPVIAKRILGARLSQPLDFGLVLFDGRPLFGKSKTIRGIAVSLAATAALAPIVGLSWQTGLLVAAFAMAGDLVSSFTKRRCNIPPSGRALGLDQVPESLLPMLACRKSYALSAIDIGAIVLIFTAGALIVSRVLYHFKVRERPY